MAIDPRKFLINTDYEMDKIIYFKQVKFTSSVEILHGLPFTPLAFGVWSTDENFNSVNPLGELDSGSEQGYQPLLSVECKATASTIKLTSAGNTSNSDIYYRVYAFEPAGSTAQISPTTAPAQKFALNTDYNYCKLMQTGTFTQSNESFAHNLGYIPQVLAWVEYKPSSSGAIQPITFGSEDTGFKITVTNNAIQIGNIMSAFTEKIHWRIYYDEA